MYDTLCTFDSLATGLNQGVKVYLTLLKLVLQKNQFNSVSTVNMVQDLEKNLINLHVLIYESLG